MHPRFYLLGLSLSLVIAATAQNTAPYWSLSGNNTASATTSKLGTTNNIPLRLFTNNAERMRIGADGRVGIGTTAPSGRLTILGSGSPAASWVSAGTPLMSVLAEGIPGNGDIVMAMASNDPAGRANLLYRRSRGTLAAPTRLAINDRVGSFFASGFDGAEFRNAAALDFIVDGTPSAGNVPTAFSVLTGTNPNTRAQRLLIGSNGNINFNSGQLFVNRSNGYLGIGTTAPFNTLHVRKGGSGATAANSNAPLVVENAGASFVNVLAPTANESGVLFGNPSNNTISGIVHNSFDNPSGLEFRTGGDISRMAISSDGNVALGFITPRLYKLRLFHLTADGGLQVMNQNFQHWEHYVAGDGSLVFNYGTLDDEFGTTRGVFNPASGAYTALSDARFKTDVQPMTTMMERISRLQPKTYRLKTDQTGKEALGFIAQEVMKVFPQLVHHHVNKARNTDVYTLDYSGFGTIAIKGVQELHKVISEQQTELDQMKEEIAELKNMVRKLSGTTVNTLSNASLGQATPNPARGMTRIKFELPESTNNARLLVTDTQGRTIRVVSLSRSGTTDLDASTLASGIYHYSLVIDGQTVATRKLTVAR